MNLRTIACAAVALGMAIAHAVGGPAASTRPASQDPNYQLPTPLAAPYAHPTEDTDWTDTGCALRTANADLDEALGALKAADAYLREHEDEAEAAGGMVCIQYVRDRAHMTATIARLEARKQ